MSEKPKASQRTTPDGSLPPADQASAPDKGAPAASPAEFGGLDAIALPPMSAEEERAARVHTKIVQTFQVQEAEVGVFAKKLRELTREARRTKQAAEAQENIVVAEALRGMLAGDLGARGFTFRRIRQLLALVAQTPLTAEELGKIVGQHRVKPKVAA